MTKNENFPSLRFKGFTYAWEQQRLKSMVSLRGRIGFRGYTKTDLVAKHEGAVTFSPSDINEEGFVDITNNDYISFEKYEESPEIKVMVGDILFTKTASIGKIGYVRKLKEKSTINPQFALLTPYNSFNGYFIFLSLRLKKFLDKVKNITGGSSVPTMSQEKLKELEIQIPEKDEQNRIATLFEKLDSLITLHQSKCDKLLNIKKGLLEKMFPDGDENVPKIRFKGFTYAWEQQKVENISNRFDNLRIPITAINRVTGTTPYYGANGIQDYVEGFTHFGEFVLIAEDGANDLKNYPVQYVNGYIWVNNHAHVLQCDDKNSTLFLKYSISNSNIASVLVGGGRAKLNSDALMKFELKVPTKPEQTKIGNLFEKLDSLITLHQRKLEKLKNLKNGFLEKMFC